MWTLKWFLLKRKQHKQSKQSKPSDFNASCISVSIQIQGALPHFPDGSSTKGHLVPEQRQTGKYNQWFLTKVTWQAFGPELIFVVLFFPPMHLLQSKKKNPKRTKLNIPVYAKKDILLKSLSMFWCTLCLTTWCFIYQWNIFPNEGKDDPKNKQTKKTTHLPPHSLVHQRFFSTSSFA